MRSILFTLSILLITFVCKAQNISIRAIKAVGFGPVTKRIQNNGEFKVASSLSQLTTFDLNYDKPLAGGHKLIIDCSGAALAAGGTNEYATSGTFKTFNYTADILNKSFIISEDDGAGNKTPLVSFKFIKSVSAGVAPAGGGAPGGAVKLVPLADVASILCDYYDLKPAGLIKKDGSDKYVHIFFDQYGNNLIGTVPQGISNNQYIVHILYPGYSDRQDNIYYSVKQKTGSFSSALLYNNTGILNQVGNNFQGAEDKNYDKWHEQTFDLGIATDDLTFDIVATTIDDDGKAVTGILQTYTVKMSPVYHGTFDIGLINSTLANPTYSLVTSPTDPTSKVVKVADDGNRGIVTVMATCYTSPVILIEKALGKKIPNYKLTGRNFLDDHGFFERIYPTIGVSIGSKTLENLFFGLNWELARGLSIFGGGHWGKINTFRPQISGYVSGVTPVTQEQFDFYSNNKWDVGWAFGAKLDILLVTNLFK